MKENISSQVYTGNVGLFVTCIVHLLRSQIGRSSLSIIESLGYNVVAVKNQSCCGQPAYNSGDVKGTRKLALKLLIEFADFDFIVVPSGSCASMIRCHFPLLFRDSINYHERFCKLAEKTYELSQFLEKHNYQSLSATKDNNTLSLTYHDSCAGLRELDIKKEPRQLLNKHNIEVIEASNAEVCCGFGGLFCVKYPHISARICNKKIEGIVKTQTDYLVGGDLGCLVTIAGQMTKLGIDMKVLHLAEVLASCNDNNNIELDNIGI